MRDVIRYLSSCVSSYKILCHLAIDVRLLRSNININIVDPDLISFPSPPISDIYHHPV